MIIIGFVFYIGYFGIKHENVFTNHNDTHKMDFEKENAEEKYKKSGIKPAEASNIFKKLLQVMADEKPYLDSKLSLVALAKILDVSPNQLSQIINQKAKVNFHDFINAYRVEEFIQNANKNKSFSLLALALDSGFNSKSSFNTIFKKQKGVTPSQFLAKQSKQQ